MFIKKKHNYKKSSIQKIFFLHKNRLPNFYIIKKNRW